MAGRKSDFTLPTLDDLFSTQELRDDAKLSKIRDIPLELIDDFPDHPFKVRDDEDMIQLVESVKERGVITPATAAFFVSGQSVTADRYTEYVSCCPLPHTPTPENYQTNRNKLSPDLSLSL